MPHWAEKDAKGKAKSAGVCISANRAASLQDVVGSRNPLLLLSGQRVDGELSGRVFTLHTSDLRRTAP